MLVSAMQHKRNGLHACRAFMEKSMTMRGGQAHVQRFWHMLLDKIVKGAHARHNRIDVTPVWIEPTRMHDVSNNRW